MSEPEVKSEVDLLEGMAKKIQDRGITADDIADLTALYLKLSSQPIPDRYGERMVHAQQVRNLRDALDRVVELAGPKQQPKSVSVNVPSDVPVRANQSLEQAVFAVEGKDSVVGRHMTRLRDIFNVV